MEHRYAYRWWFGSFRIGRFQIWDNWGQTDEYQTPQAAVEGTRRSNFGTGSPAREIVELLGKRFGARRCS